MSVKRQNKVVVKPAARKGSRIFEPIAAVLAFVAAYFILVSGLGNATFRLLAVIPGIAVSALLACFVNKKWAKLITLVVAVIFTVLCIFVNLKTFTGGAVNFYNAICTAVNENMNRGFSSYSTGGNGAGDFVFAAVISVWLAVLTTTVVNKWRMPIIIGYAVIILGLIAFGIYPKVYSIVLLGLAVLNLFLYDKEFSLSLFLTSLAATVVIFSATAACFVYNGSSAMRAAREEIVFAAEAVRYGTDKLPEGRLKKSNGMRSTDEERLVVKIDKELSNLYLKGFVGADFYGTQWYPTDKNAYVENGYDGILGYTEQGGIPTLQYAKYASLSENNERINISVENVGAKKKYVYAPYTMDSFSAGSPYYDLQLRGSTADKYTFSALSRNEKCEYVMQADWLFDDFEYTQGMKRYLTYEGQYRVFVYDNYAEIDDNTLKTIGAVVSIGEQRTINAVTQIIRRYFEANFEYDDYPDALDRDFIAEFFGGKVKKANATYFATAATYIFRAYGYAARYAEGYYLYSDTLAGGGAAVVTDKNAHAWTEVYFDGIGWLPIETTVGFFDSVGESFPAPDGAETPNKPNKPNVKPDEIEEKDPPEDPDIDPNRPSQDEVEARTRLALEISLPIVGVVVIAAAFFVIVFVHRHYKHKRKSARLLSSGEEYGRSVYFIAMHDAKPIGGFSEENLEKYGMSEETTRKFVTIIEKSVYGLYEIDEEEREFVKSFIDDLDKIVLDAMAKKNKLRYLKVKYWDCIG